MQFRYHISKRLTKPTSRQNLKVSNIHLRRERYLSSNGFTTVMPWWVIRNWINGNRRGQLSTSQHCCIGYSHIDPRSTKKGLIKMQCNTRNIKALANQLPRDNWLTYNMNWTKNSWVGMANAMHNVDDGRGLWSRNTIQQYQDIVEQHGHWCEYRGIATGQRWKRIIDNIATIAIIVNGPKHRDMRNTVCYGHWDYPANHGPMSRQTSLQRSQCQWVTYWLLLWSIGSQHQWTLHIQEGRTLRW